MILIIPEVNFLNFPLFLALSFRCRVIAYQMHPALYRFRKKIRLLNKEDYFDWSEANLIKSEAASVWESFLLRFPCPGWSKKIKHLKVGFEIKAKQEFQKEMEKLVFLKYIIDIHNKRNEETRIVSSMKFAYLFNIDPSNELFFFPEQRVISFLNILLDRLNFIVINFIKAVFVQWLFFISIVKNEALHANVRYVYDGISPRELLRDREMITFSWLINEKCIDRGSILFLLPDADFQMKQRLINQEKDDSLLTVCRHKMLRIASRKEILAYYPELLKNFLINIFFLWRNLEHLMCAGYAISIAQWIPILESLNPKIYITTVGVLGSEEPIVPYLKTAGIKTVMWVYGANICLLSRNKNERQLRNLQFSHIISESFFVWNEHYKQFIEDHPQDGVKIHIFGPLMCGDESIMQAQRSVLLAKLNIPHNPGLKYAAIFDCPPVSEKFKVNTLSASWYPDQGTLEYNLEFMYDMSRLLNEFKDIIFIYKPKRSLASGKFSYARKFMDILSQMGKTGRFFILDYNINPWISIAVADICISMPFESPTIAAIHYEKFGLFHDPSNIALFHRYEDFNEIITHAYDELKFKMSLFVCGESNLRDILDEGNLRKLQGKFPKENSSRRFREYLASTER